MPSRMSRTEPFHSGQQTNSKGKSEKVPVKFDMSKERNAGNDPLRKALTKSPPVPRDQHKFSRGSGKPYTPAGEFGKIRGRK